MNNIDNDKFFHIYINISKSGLENKVLKKDFQVLLFGEIIYYLEKTIKKIEQYYMEIKDLELKEKLFILSKKLKIIIKKKVFLIIFFSKKKKIKTKNDQIYDQFFCKKWKKCMNYFYFFLVQVSMSYC